MLLDSTMNPWPINLAVGLVTWQARGYVYLTYYQVSKSSASKGQGRTNGITVEPHSGFRIIFSGGKIKADCCYSKRISRDSSAIKLWWAALREVRLPPVEKLVVVEDEGREYVAAEREDMRACYLEKKNS